MNTIIESIWKEKLQSANIQKTIQNAYSAIYKGNFDEIEELDEEQYYNSQRNTFRLSSEPSESLIEFDKSSAKNMKKTRHNINEINKETVIKSYDDIKIKPDTTDISSIKNNTMVQARQVLKEINDMVDNNNTEMNDQPFNDDIGTKNKIDEKLFNSSLDQAKCNSLEDKTKPKLKENGLACKFASNGRSPARKDTEEIGYLVTHSPMLMRTLTKSHAKSYEKNANSKFKQSVKLENFKSDQIKHANVKKLTQNDNNKNNTLFYKDQYFTSNNNYFKKENTSKKIKNDYIVEELRESLMNPQQKQSFNITVTKMHGKNQSASSFRTKTYDDTLSAKNFDIRREGKKIAFVQKQGTPHIRSVFY